MKIISYLFTPERVTMSVKLHGVLVEAEHDVSDRFVKRGRPSSPYWRPIPPVR